MSLQITIPDVIAEKLGDNPERALLEPYIVELAKRCELWTSEVQEMLGLTRLETIQWLGRRGVNYLDLNEDEFARGKYNAAQARRVDS